MARPRTPTNVLKLRGAFDHNPDRGRARENEPTPPTCRPDPPDTLSTEARKHWDQIVGQLADAGIMTALDSDALAAYCEAYARWLDANFNLASYGSVIRGDDGIPRHSPYLRVANDSFQQMKVLITEFGLSPASRSRIQAVPKPEEENPFAAIDRLRNAATDRLTNK